MVDLSDTSMVLKQALKLSPASYYREFDEELLVETLSSTGVENAFSENVYEGKAQNVCNIMKMFGMSAEAVQLEEKLGSRFESATVLFTAADVYADSVEDTTCSALSLKESSGVLYMDMQEAAPKRGEYRYKDEQDRVLVRIYLMDETAGVKSMKVRDEVEADITLETVKGYPGDDSGKVLNTYEEYKEFLEEYGEDDFPVYDEKFFKNKKIVMCWEKSLFGDEEDIVRTIDTEKETGIIYISERKRYGEEAGNTINTVTYVMTMPKKMQDVDGVWVKVTGDITGGYTQTSADAVVVNEENKNRANDKIYKDEYCYITKTDKVEDINGNSGILTPGKEWEEIWEQIQKKISEIDLEKYDIIAFRDDYAEDGMNSSVYMRWYGRDLEIMRNYTGQETVDEKSLIRLVVVEKGYFQEGWMPDIKIKMLK